MLLKIYICIVLYLFSVLSYAEELLNTETLRLGYYAPAFPEHSYEELEIAVKVLGEEIGKQVGISTTISVFDDLKLMRKEFEEGKLNCVLANSVILEKDFDNSLFVDGFKLVKSNEIFDSVVVVTRKNAGLDQFKDLQGKRLTLLEYNPVAEYYLDVMSFVNFKKAYNKSFKDIKREKKSHQAILKLFFDQADVTCIYENNYKLATDLNPQLNGKLQIISQLNSVPQAIGMFHVDTSAGFRVQVIEVLLKLDKLTRGKQLLEMIKVDRIEKASIEDLVVTKQLIAEYKRLSK